MAKYQTEVLPLTLREQTRAAVRATLLQTWIVEKPGVHYSYNVEVSTDGRRIFLKRPARYNKGCDFQVWVEDFLRDGRDRRPRLEDVLTDLRDKRAENTHAYTELRQAIEEVWNCSEPEEVLVKHPDIRFRTGMPADLLLKLLKWLFAEQDVTYWNYSGRQMLRNAIDEL